MLINNHVTNYIANFATEEDNTYFQWSVHQPSLIINLWLLHKENRKMLLFGIHYYM